MLSDSEFSLKCRRCRQNICHLGAIQDTLVIAPDCMLIHFGLPEKREVQTEGYCHPIIYCMGEPTYRDKGKVKHCKYSKKRLPQLAFCEGLKLDAYVHVEKVTINPVRKYKTLFQGTLSCVPLSRGP